jgi:hypothetical protein
VLVLEVVWSSDSAVLIAKMLFGALGSDSRYVGSIGKGVWRRRADDTEVLRVTSLIGGLGLIA